MWRTQSRVSGGTQQILSDLQLLSWMNKSLNTHKKSALNQEDYLRSNYRNHQVNDDRGYQANKAPDRANSHRFQVKQEPQCMSQPWSTPTFDNSNTSWGEGDWSIPPIKTEPGLPYSRQTCRNVPSYPSAGEWSPEESSASNSVPSVGSSIPSTNNSIPSESNSFASGGNLIASTSSYTAGASNFTASTSSYTAGASNFTASASNFTTSSGNYIASTSRFTASSSSYTPVPSNFAPSSSNFAPSANNFAPSANNFAPSANNFTPSANNFTPSANNFAPSPRNFTPSPNSFAPSPSNFAPPANNSGPPINYGMMQQPHSSNSAGQGNNYYDNNGYYNNMYSGNYAQGGYHQPNYDQQQHYNQHPARPVDGFNQNIPDCPPVVRQPAPDFQRRPFHGRMQRMVPNIHNKRAQEEVPSTDRDFTSVFKASLMSLDSNDLENAFAGVNDPDVVILTPPSATQVEDPQAAYGRLHTSGGDYMPNPAAEYTDMWTPTRMQNSNPPVPIPQDSGPKMETFPGSRYDRPSFDDFLNSSNPSVMSKAKQNKRKTPSLSAAPEHQKENIKKPCYKQECQWTPNSFSIKKEPQDDYNSNEFDSQMSKESSPLSCGNSNGNAKGPELPKDHPSKQPAKKRSPPSTCFDRFDKKSTPSNKKVSPLSVYAKIQDCTVLNVKCRRYKKRTKPISIKEEPVSSEEMESYKQSNPPQETAVGNVMTDLVEKVEERNIALSCDFSQMDPNQLKDILLKFCDRCNIDARDFYDPSCILNLRIVTDTKNSVRASAIPKRISITPVNTKIEPQDPVVRIRRGRKKVSLEESPLVERVLRKLPSRLARGGARSKSPVNTSTIQDHTDDVEILSIAKVAKKVDVVIDLLTDCEDEAGTDAEVPKSSKQSKKKQSAKALPVQDDCFALKVEESVAKVKAKRVRKEQTVPKAPPIEKKDRRVAKRKRRDVSLDEIEKCEENVAEPVQGLRRSARCRNKKAEAPTQSAKPNPRRKRSCVEQRQRDSSIEIVDITRSSDSSSPPLLDAMEPSPLPKKRRRNQKQNKSIDKGVPTLEQDDTRTVKPPSLRRSVSKTESEDVEEEPLSPPKSANPTKKKNQTKTSASVELQEKPRSDGESKSETSEPVQNIQNGVKPEADTTNNSVVKSGSSKRKQGGPIKYRNRKKISNLTEFLINDIPPKNLMLSTFCPSQLIQMEKPTKKVAVLNCEGQMEKSIQIEKSVTALPATESLSERYRKAFSGKSFPPSFSEKDKFTKTNNSFKFPKGNPDQSFLNFKRRVILQQENPSATNSKTCSILKNNNTQHTSSSSFKVKVEPQENNSPASATSNLIKKIKKEPGCEENFPGYNSHVVMPKTNSDNSFEKRMDALFGLPGKKITRRSSSQNSESELQVVLTKLPDVQVNLQNGSVTDELLKKCEKEQMRVEAVIKQEKLSEYDSDEDKPLVCLQKKSLEQVEEEETKDLAENGIQNEVVPLPEKVKEESNLKTPDGVKHSIYFSSDDSGCGLIIDLDRRLSVEEQVQSPVPPSNTDEEIKENIGPFITSSDESVDAITDNLVKDKALKIESTIPEEEPQAEEDPEPLETNPLSSYNDAEGAQLLLQLSRGGRSFMDNSTDSSWMQSATNSADTLVSQNSQKRQGSILRNLLVENKAAATGSLQDDFPETDSSYRLTDEFTLEQQAAQNVSQQTFPLPVLDSKDDQPKSLEHARQDSRGFQKVVEKQSNDERSLDNLVSEKAILRRSLTKRKEKGALGDSSKGELIRKLFNEDTSSEMFSVPNSVEQKPNKKNGFNGHSAGVSRSITSGLKQGGAIGMQTIIKTEPSATVTSSDSFENNSGENLPTVATMVANATDNYGVDLRNVASRTDVFATGTSLQEALTSRGQIYRPVATRSPLQCDKKIRGPMPTIQKKNLATQQCSFTPNFSSPPELSRNSPRISRHLSKRLFGLHQSPPSLEPEPTLSSFTPVTPMMKQVPVSANIPEETSSHNGIFPKSARSSLKENTAGKNCNKTKTEHKSSSVRLTNGHSSTASAAFGMTNGHTSSKDEEPHSHFSCVPSTPCMPNAGPLKPTDSTSKYLPRCKGCGIEKPAFVCSGCKRHYYCSEQCQSLVWSEHSKTCSGRTSQKKR